MRCYIIDESHILVAVFQFELPHEEEGMFCVLFVGLMEYNVSTKQNPRPKLHFCAISGNQDYHFI
jgi:hypothetical protein